MSEQSEGVPVTFRGSERDVIYRLRELLWEVDSDVIDPAVELVEQGDRLVECAGKRFEVVGPDWSVVQDVYGCDEGRSCPTVSKRQRRRFEAMIRARLQAEG